MGKGLLKKIIAKLKKDSKGSSVVTVLVAFLFVSVLVAIVLSTVAVNFHMRAIDRAAKDEFYYCEKALNDIYTGLGIECSDILGDSYNKVLGNQVIGETLDSRVYNAENEKIALDRFNINFTKQVLAIVTSDKLEKKLKGYIVGDRAALDRIPSYEIVINNADGSQTTKKPGDVIDSKDYSKIKYIILKNVGIKTNTASTDPEKTGYVSAITTDIVIETPKPDFITVNKKWFDYAVIANKGIDFKSGTNKIQGNVYAGALPNNEIETLVTNAKSSNLLPLFTSKEYGGINIYGGNVRLSGDYIVSGADINVLGDDSTLSIYNNRNAGQTFESASNYECETWFESLNIRAKNARVEVGNNVSMYAENDLQVEKDSDGSTFVISGGNYYGYNSGNFDYANKTEKTKESLFRDNDITNINAKSSNSSAIIVNSKNATVDMSKVGTMVLLGSAYINHSSKAPAVDILSGNDSLLNTLESVSLKGNQEMYLVPEEFLSTTNPVYVTELNDPFHDVNIDANWFGKSYLDTSEYNVIYVKGQGGKNYAYCYLRFKNDNSRKEYVQKILKQDEDNAGGKTPVHPTGKELFEKMKATDDKQGSTLVIGDSNSHIYTENVIVQYNAGEIKEIENMEGIDRNKGYAKNMLNKYRWLDTYLDPQADRSLIYINQDKGATGVEDVRTMNYDMFQTNVTDYDNADLPLSRLVWLGKNPSATGNKLPGITHPGVRYISTDKVVDDPNVETDYAFSSKVLISKGDCEITGNSYNFIIADGNVTVKAGAVVNGFIYATGKVIFEGGTVTYDSTLMEQRIEKEIKNVKRDLDDRIKKDLAYKEYYLISYLLDIDPSTSGIASKTDEPQVKTDLKYYYGKDEGAQDSSKPNTDYRNFISYENWKKGQYKK